jgi:hypothetical protein
VSRVTRGRPLYGALPLIGMAFVCSGASALADELTRMRTIVAAAMRQGALGVSSALEYAPGPYASTDELIALASVAAQFGAIYATHMRSEQESIMASIDETIRIGREAHIPVEIWHLKAGGVGNFGLMPEIVARIDRARAGGVDIAADTYAYPAWYNDLSAFIPQWAHDGGDAKLVERFKDPAVRARLKTELATATTNWDNEWQSVSGPEAILIATVLNPRLLDLQGHSLARSDCGPISSCSIQSRSRTKRPSVRRSSCRLVCNGCSSMGSRSSPTALRRTPCLVGCYAGKATRRRGRMSWQLITGAA